MKKAIVFGATGFVGSHLLTQLLNNPDYEQVTAVVRKGLIQTHPKLKIVIGDFKSLPLIKDQWQADDVFITLGTTKKNTPDEKEYYQVDHDYPVLAAKLALENGAKSVFLLTAVGANAKSGMFYIRTKGEVERDVIALDYPHTHIFRPSMIMGSREEDRPMESLFMGVFSLINPLFAGKLSVYRGIEGFNIAKAMAAAAKNQTDKVKIYHFREMKNLL